MPLYLKQVAVYVPPTRLTLEELRDMGGIDSAVLEPLKRRGYTSVPVDSAVTSHEMVHSVLDRLQSQAAIDPLSVRYVVMPYLYHSFPYKYDLAGHLRKRYGWSRATFFSIQDLLCSNWLMALKVGGRLLTQTDSAADVLVMLTCEKAYTPDLREGNGFFVVADAAVAAVVGKQPPGDKILAVHNVTDIRTFTVKDATGEHVIVQDYAYFISMSRMIRRCLAQAGVDLADVKLFIPPNTIPETWVNLAKMLKLAPELFSSETQYVYGHSNNCDLLLNYEWLVRKGRLQPDDLYVLLSIGNGGAIGCAVCRKG